VKFNSIEAEYRDISDGLSSSAIVQLWDAVLFNRAPSLDLLKRTGHLRQLRERLAFERAAANTAA